MTAVDHETGNDPAGISIRQLHPHFAAEVVGLSIANGLTKEQSDLVKDAIDRYAVIVFRDQEALDDAGQIAFSAAFGKVQHSITNDRGDLSRRLGRPELSDISNVDAKGDALPEDDLSRRLQRPARLWHTDSSFRDPPGRYTFLAARTLPPSGGNTEFADMRAAYDALDDDHKDSIASLHVRHDLARSRIIADAPPLSEDKKRALPGAIHPLVRTQPRSGRKSLYLGSHADAIIGWAEEQGRALLDELSAFATQPCYVYSHTWRAGDLVMWDNRTTMHRATPFDTQYTRDMRRTTVADLDG